MNICGHSCASHIWPQIFVCAQCHVCHPLMHVPPLIGVHTPLFCMYIVAGTQIEIKGVSLFQKIDVSGSSITQYLHNINMDSSPGLSCYSVPACNIRNTEGAGEQEIQKCMFGSWHLTLQYSISEADIRIHHYPWCWPNHPIRRRLRHETTKRSPLFQMQPHTDEPTTTKMQL